MDYLLRGEFHLSGFQNRHLQTLLPGRTPAAIYCLLKRLRTHGLIKRVGRTYNYYLTRLGRRIVLAGLKLRRLSSNSPGKRCSRMKVT